MNPGGGDGNIVITVGGDISPLETALAAIPEAFAGITTQIDDAFAGLGVVTSGLENLAAAAGAAVAPVEDLGEQLSLFAEAPLTTLPEVNEQLALFATYAGEAASETTTLAAATSTAAASMQTLATSEESSAASLVTLVAQLGLAYAAFQIVKGAIESVVEAYGEEQKATLALGALLGDQTKAAAAIDSAKQLADNLGLAQASAFSAQQKLIALGESLSNIPRDLTAIADGAAAMNTSFDTAAQRFDMIVNSGTLMARSLTTIGLNVNDVARAMGVAGVPAATLTEAFKQLDEQQRAAVLSSAELAKNAGLAAAAASGVIGTWNQVKNAIGDVLQEMGKASDGFTGLATVIVDSVKIVGQSFIGLVATVKIAVDAIIAGFQVLLIPIAAVGQAVSDAFTGKIKEIPADLASANHAIEDALKSGWSNIQKDASDAGNSVATVWGEAMTSVAASTAAVITPIQAAQSYAQKLATEFQGVAAAFASGKVTAAQYTEALNALNKAQMDANNGLQNAGTALLLVENSYRELGVAATNAYTDLVATVKAVDSGQASWTQYTAALEALNKAQMEVNGGLEQLATAASLADAAFQNLGIASDNADTAFQGVVLMMSQGRANAIQYTDALNAMVKAHEQLAGGLTNVADQFALVVNGYAEAKVGAANAETTVRALFAAYQAGYPVLQQLIDATNAWTDANTKAAGGALSAIDAMKQVAATQQQLELSAQNTATAFGQAQAAYESGSISLGTYQKFLDAAKSAQDALNGKTKDAAAATQSATSSVNALSNAIKSFGSTAETATGPANDFATSLQYINGQWMNLGGASRDANAAVSAAATSMQYINGQFVSMGKTAVDATTSTSEFATSLNMVNGAFVNIGGSSGTAAAGISKVGDAASSAAGKVSKLVDDFSRLTDTLGPAGFDSGVNTLAEDLDKMDAAAVDAFDSLNGATLSLQLGANSLVSKRAPSTYLSEGNMGSNIPPSPGETPFASSQEIVNSTVALGGSGKYAADQSSGTTTAATAAAQAASTVSDAMVTAINEAMAANELEAAAQAQIGTDAYQALKASADAAVAAAGAAITAAQGQTAATTAQTIATQAAAASTAALADTVMSAGSTIQAAATGVAAVTAAVAQFVTPILGPGQGVGGDANLNQLNTNLPTIGSGGTAGGIGNGIKPATQLATNLIVNLNAGTVVGNNGMQQLSTMVSNEMVQQLSRLGIRLNRQ